MKYTLNFFNPNSLILYKDYHLNKMNLIFKATLKLGCYLYNNDISKIICFKEKANNFFYKTRYLKPILITLQNSVFSIRSGFTIELVLVGLGFKVTRFRRKNILQFELHFSHNLIYKIPLDISVRTSKRKLLIFGLNKQRVIDTALEIRALRTPNIYKGKGIQFLNEILKLKPGKQR